jgi:hypothetical protein
MKKKPGMGGGDNSQGSSMADANSRTEKGISRATGSAGMDEKPDQQASAKPVISENSGGNGQYEVLPDLSVEEVNEPNRKITKVTVRKDNKETVFSKVIYSWGGVYYFRHNVSISESLYFMNTGMR